MLVRRSWYPTCASSLSTYIEYYDAVGGYNPTDHVIRKKIKAPLYYTGLTKEALVRKQEGIQKTFKLDRKYEIEIEVEVKPNWYNWYVIE